jgi:PAS domain S-box-containing protein
MCVPLLAQGRVLGAITLVSTDEGRPYDAADVALIEELARRAAIAIENARLYRDAQHARLAAERIRTEVEEANGRLRAIQTVTDAALAHLPMDTLLRELMLRVRDLLAVETVAVLWLSEDEREFSVQAAVGLDNELEAGARVSIDQGLAGRVAAQRDAVIADDLEPGEPLVGDLGVRSLLGVPLLTEGHLHGVLQVGSVQARRFTPDDAHLLRLVGDRVALAINQSRLYEAERAERQRAERLAAEWQTTLGQIADGVLIADPAWRISFMNSAARELFGLSDSRLRRVQDLPIVHDGDADFSHTPLGRALERGEVVRNAEVSIQRTDGKRVLAIGSAAPVIAEDGTRLGAVRTFHDVTAQRDSSASVRSSSPTRHMTYGRPSQRSRPPSRCYCRIRHPGFPLCSTAC